MKNSKTKTAVLLAITLIIAVVSFAVVAKPASGPKTYKSTMMALDESQDTVTGLTMTGIGASTALAAIPGEAATPMADKIMDMTGYLFAILCVVTLEKYMLTLTGMLFFKLILPAVCILFCIYLIRRKDLAKVLAARFLLFGFLIYALVPASVFVSSKISDTYEQSKEYSVERMEEEFSKIENSAEKGKDQGLWDKISDKISVSGSKLLAKIENTVNTFIEYIAVLMVINIAIPIITLLLFVWLSKQFFGLSGPINLPRFHASRGIRSVQKKLKGTNSNLPSIKE